MKIPRSRRSLIPRAFLTGCILSCTTVAPALAEDLHGTLTGTVTDLDHTANADGLAHSNVFVEIVGVSKQTATVKTEVPVGESGRFYASDLRPGAYWVQAVRGDHRSRPEPIRLVQGQMASLQLEMLGAIRSDESEASNAETAAPDGNALKIDLLVFDDQRGVWETPKEGSASEVVTITANFEAAAPVTTPGSDGP